MADPRDIGRVALSFVPMQDGVQFVADGIRHTVNSTTDPRYPGLAYHSQYDLATRAKQTNIIGPDGTAIG